MTAVTAQLDRRDRRPDRSAWLWQSAWSKQSGYSLVISARCLAANAAANALEEGRITTYGALPAAFARNAIAPVDNDLGGMGAVLGRELEDPRQVISESICSAPGAATPEVRTTAHHRSGYRAVAFPGADADRSEHLTRFGYLLRADVTRAAIALARQGHAVISPPARLADVYAGDLITANAVHFADEGRVTSFAESRRDGAASTASRR
jgi:gamma-glutamyltranspeptidase